MHDPKKICEAAPILANYSFFWVLDCSEEHPGGCLETTARPAKLLTGFRVATIYSYILQQKGYLRSVLISHVSDGWDKDYMYNPTYRNTVALPR